MKITLIILGFLIGFFNKTYGQPKKNGDSLIEYCQIKNSNIDHILKEYIARNFGHPNQNKGIVIVKLPDSTYNDSNFVYHISEMSSKRRFKESKPTAYTVINGQIVLLYGIVKSVVLIKADSGADTSFFSKHLINVDVVRHHKDYDEVDYQTFDPEILEVVIRKNLVVAKKELSKDLDLTPPH